MVTITGLACLAILVPIHRSDLGVATAAVNYLGGFFIAGGFLRQLRLDLTYAAPGLLMLAYLFVVYLLAQAAGEHRTVLTYLCLIAAILAAVLLVVLGALVLAAVARLLSRVTRLGRAVSRRLWEAASPRLPDTLVTVLAAPREPTDPVLPPAVDPGISRRTLYVGVGFLTYGLLLTLRTRYLSF